MWVPGKCPWSVALPSITADATGASEITRAQPPMRDISTRSRSMGGSSMGSVARERSSE